MLLFDLAVKPFDSYWKKRFKIAERERRRLEANAACERGLRDDAEEVINELHDRIWKQGQTIDALNKRIAELEVAQKAEQEDLAEEDAREAVGDKEEVNGGPECEL